MVCTNHLTLVSVQGLNAFFQGMEDAISKEIPDAKVLLSEKDIDDHKKICNKAKELSIQFENKDGKKINSIAPSNMRKGYLRFLKKKKFPSMPALALNLAWFLFLDGFEATEIGEELLKQCGQDPCNGEMVEQELRRKCRGVFNVEKRQMKIPKQKKEATKKQKKTNAVITDEEKRQQTLCEMRQKSDIEKKVDLIKSAKFSDFDLKLCYQNIPKQLISDVWDEI